MAVDEVQHRFAAELAEFLPEGRIRGPLAQRCAPEIRVLEHEFELARHRLRDYGFARRAFVPARLQRAALLSTHLGDGKKVLVLVDEAQVERADRAAGARDVGHRQLIKVLASQ
jgi:hypothetical protein